jgi:hypothetical protein
VIGRDTSLSEVEFRYETMTNSKCHLYIDWFEGLLPLDTGCVEQRTL